MPLGYDDARLAATVLTAMPVALSRCSADLRYLWVSDRYAAWLGIPAAEIAGKPIADVIGQDGMEAIRPYVQAVLGGRAVEYEQLLRFSSIGERWIKAEYCPTFDRGGGVDGWVAHVVDVTARKRAEEELRLADQRKDEFLGMLGHELRNPLTPIVLATEVMARRGAGALETQRQVIERQARHLTRLVDDLLDVSRITRGKIELQKERVSLSRIVREAVDIAGPLLERHSHRLTIDVPDDLIIEADPARLVQVLANLLTNAAHYTDPGGDVRVVAGAGAGAVTIRVADTGTGISAALLPAVFDAFVQEKQPLDRRRGGLGIGLTVVRRLVELHGGSVSAHSDGVGKGSEFVISLPHERPAPIRLAAATDAWGPAGTVHVR